MRRSTLAIPVILGLLAPAALLAQDEGGEPSAPPPLLFHHPRVFFGAGSLYYREQNFETAPGLESHFREDFLAGGAGWDFILSGHHTLSLDFEYLGTDVAEESWKDAGEPIQTNDLQVRRLTFSFGYSWSTWNRAADPRDLRGGDRLARFSLGLAAPLYRHQQFDRSDFIDRTAPVPTVQRIDVRENFDMIGAEGRLELEVGPRHIAAGFIRGRTGGEYVAVRNDGFSSFGIDEDDSTIGTGGIHGSVEAGVVSQFARNIEVRLGYRYFRQEVFEKKKTFFSSVSPTVVILELPDNTTEMHMVFLETAFPF